MVGLGVRDVGGRAPGREEGRKCCGAKVRVDLPIRANFLMTVEPGLYFVPALLDDPERREKFKDAVAWDDARPLAKSRRRPHRGQRPHHRRRAAGADSQNCDVVRSRCATGSASAVCGLRLRRLTQLLRCAHARKGLL